MQLGSVNSFSTNQVPLNTKPKMLVSDAVTTLQTTKMQPSYSLEAAYRSVDSDADIGIYNPSNVTKGFESKSLSMSFADEQNSVVDRQFAPKSKYAVTPNQATVLAPIRVTGTRFPIWGGGGGGPFGNIFDGPVILPHKLRIVEFHNQMVNEAQQNGQRMAEAIFGRAFNNEELVEFGQVAAYSRMRGNSLNKAKKDGYAALMNTPAARDYQDNLLQQKLTAVEGRRKDVYKDNKGNLTVGIGHKVLPSDNLRLGDIISDARVDQLYRQDSSSAMSTARQQATNLGIVSSKIVVALADVNFQLGNNWGNEFPNTWAALRAGDFNRAITEIQTSLWATQTPERTNNFITAIRDYMQVHTP